MTGSLKNYEAIFETPMNYQWTKRNGSLTLSNLKNLLFCPLMTGHEVDAGKTLFGKFPSFSLICDSLGTPCACGAVRSLVFALFLDINNAIIGDMERGLEE